MKRTLKVRNETGMGHASRVWLNDFEITEFLSGLSLNIEVGALNEATLHVRVSELDVEADILASLEARLGGDA